MAYIQSTPPKKPTLPAGTPAAPGLFGPMLQGTTPVEPPPTITPPYQKPTEPPPTITPPRQKPVVTVPPGKQATPARPQLPGGAVTSTAAGTPDTPAEATPTTPATPAAPADAGGDSGYLAEVRAAGAGKSEDYARFSDADLLAWKPYYVGNGKYRNIYGDIVDKPDERGPNTPHNRNGTGDQGDFGYGWNDSSVGDEGGGGSGGGGGGGGGGNPASMAGASDTIWQSILSRLNGDSRYSPAAMQSMMGALKNQAENQATAQTDQSNADLAARGLARSSIGASAQQAIRAGVGQSMQSAQAGMMKSKIDADFADKSEAIKQGIDWLNSLRDYTSRMAATAAQKEAALANIQLGYAQMQHQTDLMREQYAQQLQYYGLTS